MAPVLLLLLLTAACGNSMSVTGQLSDEEYSALSPQAHVFAARLDFNRVLSIVTTYARQPACSATVIVGCSDTEVVRYARDILKEIDGILDEAEIVVRGGGDAPVSSLEASRTALGRLTTYLVAKGALQ